MKKKDAEHPKPPPTKTHNYLLYKRRVLYDGKVKIAIHDSLHSLGSIEIAKLYPDNQRPEYIFSTINGSATIALAYINGSPTLSTEALHETFLGKLRDQKADIVYSAVEKINNRAYAVFELIRRYIHGNTLVKTVATIINGRVFMCSFTYNTKNPHLDKWKEICEGSLQSIQLID
jgi:hypothetical protein